MPSPPRWLAALQKTIAEHSKDNVFQIASLDSNNIPHVRSQIYRTTLTPKLHPSLPIFISSTDIRTPKVSQIIFNPSNPGSKVEVCWWIDPAKEQFRIQARAFIIPSPSHPAHEKLDVQAGKGLYALVKEDKVDLEDLRRDTFNSMSSHMKASWCRPQPGSVLKGGYEESKSWPEKVPKIGEAETDEDKKNLEMALGNFALVALEPEEVDYVELGIVPNRRRRFVRKGEDWTEEYVVP
ncbi:hypothetical protein JAAARDRAFT_146673 [Jaapia argillacea MUCL 33604]|uniref:Pyridoxamine 5'-phosphate oxidase Alr4036 family FMN-binding domain-containing protein n=1 Tax=Jaapia argillacea MUCL 33604 TaxID=933084 RepID=A0A067Q7C9_9AGAM|nr:hypothetical protein JAAARDRAFT_146673 [Jaapia argillacea MUCL 33604]